MTDRHQHSCIDVSRRIAEAVTGSGDGLGDEGPALVEWLTDYLDTWEPGLEKSRDYDRAVYGMGEAAVAMYWRNENERIDAERHEAVRPFREWLNAIVFEVTGKKVSTSGSPQFPRDLAITLTKEGKRTTLWFLHSTFEASDSGYVRASLAKSMADGWEVEDE